MENQTLGKCCICEQENESVRNLITLKKKSSDTKGGWGCFTCGLSPAGAVAVLCDGCLDLNLADQAEIKFACLGYPKENRRIELEKLTEDFDHDLAKHPEEWERAIFHFLTVKAQYEDFKNMPGVNTGVALETVFAPLEARYLGGERTRELFDAMMAVE